MNFVTPTSISNTEYLYFFLIFSEYEIIKDRPGDSYYVRAMFDRLPDPNSDPRQLSFRKDDILYIDNTMYQGTPGQWSAFLVGSDGIPDQDGWGVVPSKYKVEEELVSKNYTVMSTILF